MDMTKMKSLIAGTVIAVVSVGGAGVAGAQGTHPTKPAPVVSKDRGFCDKWVPRLPGLDAKVHRDEQRIDALTKAIAVARAHHRDDLAHRLELQRDDVQRDRDRLIALVAVIHARCDH
jgi:hypothetical protein